MSTSRLTSGGCYISNFNFIKSANLSEVNQDAPSFTISTSHKKKSPHPIGQGNTLYTCNYDYNFLGQVTYFSCSINTDSTSSIR